MNSINFPKMFSNSSNTKIISNHAATSQNLILLLKSDKKSLFGDPFFGTILKRLIYEQGDKILQELVIDEIYTCIATFMPQIKVNRNDIKLSFDKSDIYVTIECINLIDFQTDLYNIKLTDDEQE